MKHIMISIKPKWVAKILNGEKTIEIRKSFHLVVGKLFIVVDLVSAYFHYNSSFSFLIVRRPLVGALNNVAASLSAFSASTR